MRCSFSRKWVLTVHLLHIEERTLCFNPNSASSSPYQFEIFNLSMYCDQSKHNGMRSKHILSGNEDHAIQWVTVVDLAIPVENWMWLLSPCFADDMHLPLSRYLTFSLIQCRSQSTIKFIHHEHVNKGPESEAIVIFTHEFHCIVIVLWYNIITPQLH